MDINDFKNNVLEIVDPDNNDFMEHYVNFNSYTLNKKKLKLHILELKI